MFDFGFLFFGVWVGFFCVKEPEDVLRAPVDCIH